MKSIQFGWIDYSSEHRNKVMAVLHALSAPGAVDEMGIGQIRDGFANILFPGTSTIQTRAKYFFIVPYILMELEQQKYLKPKQLLDKLNEIELDLIDILKTSGESGVIGETAGKNLKRKPSTIYWAGLRTFGIFRYPRFSLDDYTRAVTTVNKEMLTQKAMGKRVEEENQNDDQDAYQNLVPGGFWRCLPPAENWQQNVRIQLNAEEAGYLKDRISKSPQSRESLLAFLLNSDPLKVRETVYLDALDKVLELPERIRHDYLMARRFSDFIYGANLRYNVILTDGKSTRALALWDNWCKSLFVTETFAPYDTNEAMDYLKITNYRLRRFLRLWKETFLSGNPEAMDQLIIQREIELKSQGRAKLKNPSVYVYRGGDGLRGGKLEYRFGNAKVLIDDIFTGLEEEHA